MQSRIHGETFKAVLSETEDLKTANKGFDLAFVFTSEMSKQDSSTIFKGSHGREMIAEVNKIDENCE